ncbi:hypothetical protein JCM8115_002823 [Rhodotorula mucilaginosa]
MASTPRSTATRSADAATTPHRRSQIELLDQLNSLFDSLETSSSASSSQPTSPLFSSDPFNPTPNPPPATETAHRTAPLRLVPTLLDAFEHKRGIQLLNPQEREQLQELVPEGMADQPVGVEQLLSLLVGLGVTAASSGGPSPVKQEGTPSMNGIAAARLAAAATATTTTPTMPPPTTSTTTPNTMLRPDAAGSYYRTGDGSPVRRGGGQAHHRRTPSTTSSASSSSKRTSGGTASPFPSGSSSSSHIPVPISRRRTIPKSSVPGLKTAANDSAAAGGSGSGSGKGSTLVADGPKTLRRRGTLSDLAALEREESSKQYLGVALRDTTTTVATAAAVAGEPSEEEQTVVAAMVKKVKTVLNGKGPTREQDLLSLLAPLSSAQLEAVNLAYSTVASAAGGVQTLLEAILADRNFKGVAELALRGLLMGPLDFDVYLVRKALEASPTNDDLLIELLVGRSPSSLASLRAAFAREPPPRSAGPPRSSTTSVGGPNSSASPQKPAASAGSSSPSGKQQQLQKPRSLDVAILSAYSANTRIRKVWEIALKGQWADLPALTASVDGNAGDEVGVGEQQRRSELSDGEAYRSKLLQEDLDQLKVALRRGGSTETTAKILLARSPVHLRKLCEQFALSTGGNSTLTRAIKQSVPAGVLQRMFLHAAEAAKHVSDMDVGYGAWRDVKVLQRVINAEKGTKRDELVVRLLRLRWDRTRFAQVQTAFETKYRVGLVDRLARGVVPAGIVAETVRILLEVDSLSTAMALSPSADTVSMPSTSPESTLPADVPVEGRSDSTTTDDRDPAELEAEGELSDPSSPRSSPAIDRAALGQYDGQDREEASILGELARSTSSLSTRSEASFDRPSSAMSSRSRTSLVEGPRPSSSAGGNAADSSRLSSSSLRHSRPMAPSRAKRRQSEELARSQRGGSEEPLSPREEGVISPTLSHASRGSFSRSDSMTISDMSLSSSVASHHSSDESQSYLHDDGTDAIDTSSFFATPLSPIRDESRPSSIFFPENRPSTPPAPASTFDSGDFFATVTGTPDSPERYFASLMRRDGSQTSNTSATGSRPSRLTGDGLLDSLVLADPVGHARDGSGILRGNEQFQQLLQHAQDLARKIKDNESRFHASASQFESEVADLEGQLEEARSELHAKRREEKELRSVEKEHVQQISVLEGEVANLNKSLERSRESYESMKRSYTATCEEADRLRTLVADLRREHRSAEEAIQGHSLQVQQFERDHERLQQAVEKLEGELAAARQAQDALDDQKQENLLLKETIDKLRFEIEEMRSVGPRSGFLEAGQSFISPTKSLAATISRSIGREIATQMSSAVEDDESDEDASVEREDIGDDVDDIIVTTRRRIRKRTRDSTGLANSIVRVDTSVDMADADCQTAGPSHSVLAVQTDLTAVNSELVEKRKTSEEPLYPELTTRQMQDELAMRLGVDVNLVKQLADAKQAGAHVSVTRTPTEMLQPVAVPARRSPRWRTRLASVPVAKAPAYLVNVFPNSARPYVSQLLDSGLSLVLYSATIYLIGVLSGSRFMPQYHRHYFSPMDFGLYASDTARWEGLIVGAGADGGFAPEGWARILFNALWSGVRTAGRVPV